MRKVVLVFAAMACSFAGMAQEKMVSSALYELNGKNFDEAKADIDKAQSNPETKDKAKTLFAKAQVYFGLMTAEKYKSAETWKEGTQALIKLVEVKPEYEKDDVNGLLFYGAGLYYNTGTKLYNEKKNEEAVEDLKYTIKIHDLAGGKRFEKFPSVKRLDTFYSNALLTLARCAYFSGNYEEAISAYNKIKKDPIVKSVDNYNILLASYENYNNKNANKLTTEEFAAIQEARAAYPNDANIKTFELNYFIKNNKLSDLVKKTEEDAAKEPTRADLQLNLGMAYQGLANPKDGKKPANADELNAKAETAYAKAISLAPEDANINFNLGILYFNQGVELNSDMVKITGTSDADNKKYDDLKGRRDVKFAKATPYLEKCYFILSPKYSPSMSGDDKETYHSTLSALKQLYAVQNKTDKMKEMGEEMKQMEAEK